MANLNIKFNNKTYSIDPASLADATARLEAHLMGMMEERLEGDGAEYYTLAPTALSFRSTAPLNELQEVQINGVTVDPANYILEEGSTIVTFPIEYLKTLNVGSYEVAVASNSKTVKGDFRVKAPNVNEHGFYYNQPYVGYVQGYGNVALFYREGGVLDFIITDNDYIETATYTVSGNAITNNVSLGAIPATISNGDEIQCAALGATFKLGDTSIVADEDYIYIYKEDLGGYEVQCINKTKAEYGAIKTGINGINTVKLADDMFRNWNDTFEINTFLTVAPIIPNSVISIGEYAFYKCENLTDIKLPNNLISIGTRAFYNCAKLKSIEFPDSIMTIDSGAFESCNLTDIKFPNSLTTIHAYAFGQNNFKSIEIPKNVTSIGHYAFCYCYNLTSAELLCDITEISHNTFEGCSSLASVKIPNSLTTIKGGVFLNCKALTTIIFEGTTAQWNAIDKIVGWNSGVPATHVHCIDGDVAL